MSRIRRARAGLARGARRALASDSPLRRALPDDLGERVRQVRRHAPVPLARVLDRQLGGAGPRLSGADFATAFAQASRRPDVPSEARRLWVAPANFAGQGDAWARAVGAHVAGVGARSMAVAGRIAFPTDQRVDPAIYRDLAWQRAQERYVLDHYTHVLVESERPVLGTLYGRTCEGEVPRLRAAGLGVALISHGSDLRVPSDHAARHPDSPFAGPQDASTAILQRQALRNRALLARFDGPVYVSTPDLLDDAPHATWCPTVVDVAAWSAAAPLLERPVPRVVHIPSSGRLKGTPHIDAALEPLAAAGLIDYRRLEGVDRSVVRAEYEAADLVVDQVAMGLYGVAAIEAMACGRVVLAYVGDTVRARIRAATGADVPILEATPATLRALVESIAADRDTARAQAAAGPAYVRAVHDGRLSASVLARWLTP